MQPRRSHRAAGRARGALVQKAAFRAACLAAFAAEQPPLLL